MLVTKIISGDQVPANKTISNTLRAILHLENGPIEVYDAHINLIGNIEKGLLQIDSVKEGQTVSDFFYIRKGIGIISTFSSAKTIIEIYIDQIRNLNTLSSLETLEKELAFQQKKKLNILDPLQAKTKDYIAFLDSAIACAKDLQQRNLRR